LRSWLTVTSSSLVMSWTFKRNFFAHYWVPILSFIYIISLSSIPKILSINNSYFCVSLDWWCLHLIISNHTSISHFWIPNVCLILKILIFFFFSVVISSWPELVVFLYFFHILLILFIFNSCKALSFILSNCSPSPYYDFLIWEECDLIESYDSNHNQTNVLVIVSVSFLIFSKLSL
jgi:hypothetical protein